MPNALYYGDNLPVLRDYLPDESVDLIYLDPPFNSRADYNVLFQDRSGEDSPAQLKAFSDTWEWTQETERTFEQEIIGSLRMPALVKEMMSDLRRWVGRNDMMSYLVMMTPRLVELRRVLKPTGSLYLHCDPTASHFLRLTLDAVFGRENFRSEIVWRRTNAHNNTTMQYGPIHDTILFYTKGRRFTFHPGTRPYTRNYIESRFTREDDRGRYQLNYLTGPGRSGGASGQPWQGFDPTPSNRHWAIPRSLRPFLPEGGAGMNSQEQLDALLAQDLIVLPAGSSGQPMYKQYIGPGVPYQDIWAYQPNTRGVLYDSPECIDEDVKYLESEGEKLPYPTQKPVGLLERIINTSSNPGDVALDPFCGCGTAVAAAQKLGRQWIGMDITHLAVALMKNRLKDDFDLEPLTDYAVIGEPQDRGGARALWEQDPFQFQYWAVSLLEAQPQDNERRRGADGGIDGLIYFVDGPRRAGRKIVIQVKGGSVAVSQVRELAGVVERERAVMGLFISLEEPTRPMERAAVAAGFYHSELWQRDFPKIQIRTIAQLLAGEGFALPPRAAGHQGTGRARRPQGEQGYMAEMGAAYQAAS